MTQGDPSASGGQHWHGDPNPWGHNPQNQGYGAYPDQPMPANRVETKGFFAALFDFSFQSFITVAFAKVIYAILLAVAIGSWLLPAFSMMSESTGLGMTFLLLGWIPGFVLVIIYRIALEVTVSMVRTSQNTAATREEIELLRRDLRGRA